MASEAFIEVIADTSGVEGEIVRDMTRAVNAAERRIPEIDVEVNVDTDRLTRDVNGRLRNTRGRFVRDGEELGQSLGDGLEQGLTPRLSSVGSEASTASGFIGSLSMAFGVLSASGLATGAALAAIPALFGGIGIVAAAQSKTVQKSFSGLAKHVSKEVEGMVGPIRKVLISLAGTFTKTFDAIAPSLKQAFAAVAPIISILGKSLASFIKNLVPVLAGLVKATTPVIKVLGAGLASLGTSLGKFFTNLTHGVPGAVSSFQGLFDIINAILPFVGELLAQLGNALGPVLKALGSELSSLLTAFQPLLPIIGQLLALLGNELGLVLKALGPALTSLVTAFLPLLPIIGQLGTLLTTALVPIISQFAALIVSLAPPLIQIVSVLVTALAPILQQLPAIIAPLLTAIGGIVIQVVTLAAQILTQLMPALMPLIVAVVNLAVALTPLVAQLLPLLFPLITLLSTAIIAVLPILAKLITKLVSGLAYGINTYVIPTVRLISDLLRGDFSGALQIAEKIVGHVANDIIQYFVNIKTSAVQAGYGAINAIRNTAQNLIAIVKAIAPRLYASGQAMIQSLARGILSQLGSAISAARKVVSAVSNFFPHSPAKEGPFSGKGYTTHSGIALMSDFIKGIESQTPALRRMISQSLGTTQLALSPSAMARNAREASFVAPSQALSHGLSFGGENIGTPTVTVMIGNQVINDHIDVQISRNNQSRDRASAQGVRR